MKSRVDLPNRFWVGGFENTGNDLLDEIVMVS